MLCALYTVSLQDSERKRMSLRKPKEKNPELCSIEFTCKRAHSVPTCAVQGSSVIASHFSSASVNIAFSGMPSRTFQNVFFFFFTAACSNCACVFVMFLFADFVCSILSSASSEHYESLWSYYSIPSTWPSAWPVVGAQKFTE